MICIFYLHHVQKASSGLPIHTRLPTKRTTCFSLSCIKGRLLIHTYICILHEKLQRHKAWRVSIYLCKLLCKDETMHWSQWKDRHGYVPDFGGRWHHTWTGMVWFARLQLLVFREAMSNGMESMCLNLRSMWNTTTWCNVQPICNRNAYK